MIYVKLTGMAVFWSGAFISGKVLTSHGFSPLLIAFIRFAIASVPLLILLRWREPRETLATNRLSNLFYAVVLGLTGVFAYNFFFFSGLKYIPANRAAVLLANSPILVGFCSSLFLGEKLGRGKIIGLLFSVLGALVVISHGDIASLFAEGIGRGDVFFFLAVAMWAIYSVVGKVAMRTLSPLRTTTYSSVMGCALLAVPALLDLRESRPQLQWHTEDLLHLFYLALCATVLGFLWYYEGVKKLGAGRAAQFINLVPIFGVTLSAIVLHEPLSWSLAAGAGLAFTGIYLSNFWSGKLNRPVPGS